MAAQNPYPPQPPQGQWQQPPPAQGWYGQQPPAAPQQWGAPPQQPGPYWAPPPSPHAYDGRTKTALIFSFIGIFMSLCCLPIGITCGIVGASLAREPRRQAKEYGYRDDLAGVAFWVGIAAVVVGVLHLLLNLGIMIFFPEVLDNMYRTLGLK